MRYAAAGGVAFVGLLVIVGLALPSLPGRQGGVASRPSELPGTQMENQGRGHLAAGQSVPETYYNSVPPTSGLHALHWQPCGTYDQAVPDEVQVHNLEHGFVIVHYNTEDQVIIDQLKNLVQGMHGYPDYLLLAPYPKMSQTVALTAWNAVQYLETVDSAVVTAFVDAYRGRGPEVGAPAC